MLTNTNECYSSICGMLNVFFLAFPTGHAWLDVSSQTNCQDKTRNVSRCNLLGSLLLLLSLAFILFCWGFLNRCRGRFLSFWFFLDSNEEANDILRFDHVVFINLKFTEDVINLSLGHLVSPGHESMLEHLGVNLSL